MRHACSINEYCTPFVTVAVDGAKLPLFIIFKGSVNGPFANSLLDIMTDGMYGCTKVEGCMDN